MHASSLSFIQAIVHADLARGQVIDVDACCRIFGVQYPELSRKQIQDAVLEMVSIAGGGAVWGADNPPTAKPPAR
jgi:hypothetical protein